MKDKRAIIQKYIQGNCSPEELAFLQEWIKTEEAGSLMEEIIEKQWHASDDHHQLPPDSQQLFEKINRQLPKQHDKFVSKSKSRILPLWKYAAVVAILMVSGIFFMKDFSKPDHEPPAQAERRITKTVERGQKRTLTFQDGSQVTLNAESSITFPEHFSDSMRRVYLEGEGFFEVTKDARRPFIVETPFLKTRVLGTSFNIKAYPADKVANVALVTGTIEVQQQATVKTADPVVLKPGEMVVYQEAGQLISKTDFDVRTTTAWKDGIIYFQAANYTEITEVLGRWYDVTFGYLTQQTPQWQYNGEFDDKSLEYVLESISYACNFKYTLKGKQVIIDEP